MVGYAEHRRTHLQRFGAVKAKGRFVAIKCHKIPLTCCFMPHTGKKVSRLQRGGEFAQVRGFLTFALLEKPVAALSDRAIIKRQVAFFCDAQAHRNL